MRKVLVFGAFDGLHIGHLDFFRQAKKFGDYLIVSVGTNKNVESFKGKAPLFSQAERLELVNELAIVDKAVLGAEDDFYGAIRGLSPDVICLGYDQWAAEEEVRRELDGVGLTKTKIVRLKPYKKSRAKSTIVKKNSVDF
ncbi:adenylyltransferase/cytidyltransferase family protein [Candidatus Curtissbacteria bacterium]|nr:adenylyltransferase/cytidyltransferase family protein [Candidatus Curtissbacteria bacterium]